VDKQKTQLIVIGVGIVVFIIVMAGNLKKKPAKTPESAISSVSLVQGPETKTQGPTTPLLPADAKRIKEQSERAGLTWGRDPFNAYLDKEYQRTDLKLQGISFGKDKTGFAFINDEIVKKGDKVGDYEVAEIQKDKVLLKKGSQSFYLAFPYE
jgi:hypothetical protein